MLNPVKIGRHQVGAEFGRDAIHGPDLCLAFIGTKDQPVALLPDIPAFLRVADDRQLRQTGRLAFGNLGDGVRHEVLMQHRHRRDVDAHHMPDLPPPCPGGIDDMAGDDRSLGGLHHPFPGLASDRLHRVEALDGRPAPLRDLRHGIGGKGWVHMAVIGLVNTAKQPVEPRQRVQFGNPLRAEDFPAGSR